MTKIAYTGGGTVGHVSVNLSLIPTKMQEKRRYSDCYTKCNERV